jgi:hypothetical protein
MALGSTQPLTEMSTRCISWDKGGRYVRLTTLPPSCVVMKSGNFNFLEPSGSLQACNGTALPFTVTMVGRTRLILLLYVYYLPCYDIPYELNRNENSSISRVGFTFSKLAW